MREKQMEAEKPVWRGEAALVAAVIMNTFGVVLMLYSGSGISASPVCRLLFRRSFRIFHLGHGPICFKGF